MSISGLIQYSQANKKEEQILFVISHPISAISHPILLFMYKLFLQEFLNVLKDINSILAEYHVTLRRDLE